ncbi:MAG: hypothetical protein ACE5JG_11595 [Planctomycetota bacterium]
MRCMMCQEHATFDQAVFVGTSPTTVRLCDGCAARVDAQEHMNRIKAAPDHQTKNAAAAEFLKAIGK